MELELDSPAMRTAGSAAVALAFLSLFLFVDSMRSWKAWLRAPSGLERCPLTFLDLLVLIGLVYLLVYAGAGLLFPAVILVAAIFLYARHATPAVRYWGLDRTRFSEALRAGGRIYLTIYLPFLILAFGSMWLFKKWGYEDLFQDPVKDFLKTANPVPLLIQALMLAPVAEEILFRGIFFPFLKEKVGTWAGIASSGLLFAVAHDHTPSFAVLALLGMLLALIYDRTGKLGYCISLHFFFNLGTTFFLLVQKYGGTMASS